MVKVIIWGTGLNAEHCINCLNFDRCEIIAFTESVPGREYFKGLEVIVPEKLVKFDYDYLIVASQFFLEIEDTLDNLRIPKSKVVNWLNYCNRPYSYPEETWELFSDEFLNGFLLCTNENKNNKGFEFYKEKYIDEYEQLLKKECIYVYDLRIGDDRLAVSRLLDILINQGSKKSVGLLFIPDETKLDFIWYHNLLFHLEQTFFILWDEQRFFYSGCMKRFGNKFIFDRKGILISRPVYVRQIPASKYMNFFYCFEPTIIQTKVDNAKKVHFFYLYSSRIGETIKRVGLLKKYFSIKDELVVLIPEDYSNTLSLGTNACLMELISREFCMIRDEGELWFWVRNIMQNPQKFYFYKDIKVNIPYRVNGKLGVPILDFLPKELEFGKKIIKRKLSLHEYKYVCITVRDAKYMSTVLRSIDEHHNDYRNDDVTVVKEAIEFLEKQDIPTVRMGQIVECFHNEYKNCIDFPNRCYDEYLDLILHRHCKFILGCSTGATFISVFFGRPLALWIYYYPIISSIYHAFKKEDLVIFNRIKNIAENKILSIFETIQKYYEFQIVYKWDYEYFSKNGLCLIPITSEEIRCLTNEMNSKLDGTWVEQSEDKKLEHSFYRIVDEVYKDKGIELKNYTQPTIATTFLRKNKELLRMESN